MNLTVCIVVLLRANETARQVSVTVFSGNESAIGELSIFL